MTIKIISNSDEIKQLLSKKIETSNQICIATGYFSHRIFEIFKNEFLTLIKKKGKFKLIIGSDTDIESIEFFKTIQRLSRKDFLKHFSSRYFPSFADLSFEALECAFNLFNENIIEVKVGISNEGGIFHVKEYLFENDEENGYITGSLNFTKSALILNHESINYVENDESYNNAIRMFEERWNNTISSVTTIEINRYIVNKIKDEIYKREKAFVEESGEIKPHGYQKDAINELMNHDFNGFLEMATGTGKTFTSLLGLREQLKRDGNNHLILIVVPLKHLAEQWKGSVQQVLGKDIKILMCHSETSWRKEISGHVDRSNYDNVVSIIVKDSFIKSMNDLGSLIKRTNNILIVDEAHNLTKENIDQILNMKKLFKSCVGLSATPENYLDNERTKKMFELFSGSRYKFDLKRAIDEGFLTRYRYNPYIIELEQKEEDLYKNLSSLIKKELNPVKKENLLDQRSEVLSKARNKIKKLIEVVSGLDDMAYTLIYCSPGSFTYDDSSKTRYIDQVSVDLEEKVKLKTRKSKITYSEGLDERKSIIERFKSKKIDIILAIKCLDEGYDIPCIRNAFILHSTRNPSEYIQRRGRVLRKYAGKDFANIYDFIVRVDGFVPDEEWARFNEYVLLADNKTDLKKVEIEILEEKNGKL